MIRPAEAADVAALVTLERRCFETDRLSRRSFRHLLTRGNAALLVDDAEGRITGYSLVLFHRNTSLARLYSFCVDPDYRRLGIAGNLLERSEDLAREHEAAAMRLEVRLDNDTAIRFYERAGYHRFSTYPAYYEDHMDAARLEKQLVPHLPAELASVPYYAQTLEFTCGPACLMMALKALDPGIALDRMLELRLWREATTVFMTSGHGGCGPFGLALSAWKRGFEVEIHVSRSAGLFMDSVRSTMKKEVIRLVQADFLREIAGTGIKVRHSPLTLATVRKRFDRGRVPIVLVSAYRLTGDKAPHWMVLTGFDDRFVYVHEPYVDEEEGETKTMCIGIPIRHQEFERMMRYGRSKQFALLMVGPKRATPLMSSHLIVVDRISDWRWNREGLSIQDFDTYVFADEARRKRPVRVINLCRRFGYLNAGYYCSLLAESRNDLPMPTVADIIDLSRRNLYAFALPDLERILRASLKRMANPPTEEFDLHVFFGRADDGRFRRLGAEAFDIFRYPLLRIRIRREKQWGIAWIRPVGLHRVPEDLSTFFEESLRRYVRVPKSARKKPQAPLYELAVLVNPNEVLRPSNDIALQRLARAGRDDRVDVEFLTARDLQRVPEFDALFIRETTALYHHTFRFARKAELEGIPVIDDTRSIVRCTNKVFLAEALKANGIPAPRTVFLDRASFDAQRIARMEDALGYPMVLKIPDGSFSRGVERADNREMLVEHARRLFGHSRIILAQEYMYTPFDWRIGLLGGTPLFACRYYMSRAHWQIYRHQSDGKIKAGAWETFAVDAVPPQVLTAAARAAALIGDGLYGVDLKETDSGVYVIEVNDNPNIDAGVEDMVLKHALYERLVAEFIRRIEAMRNG